MKKISEQDATYYRMARAHIAEAWWAAWTVWEDGHHRALEIGPEELKQGARENWHTLDIAPGCDIHADITNGIPSIDTGTYDVVICLDVLEHCIDPFAAVREIRRITRHGGLLFASAPWNFRIHGPQPDLWRFNQNTWRLLLKDWDDLTLDVLETPDRWLMPIHINATARCNHDKAVIAKNMTWELIK